MILEVKRKTILLLVTPLVIWILFSVKVIYPDESGRAVVVMSPRPTLRLVYQGEEGGWECGRPTKEWALCGYSYQVTYPIPWWQCGKYLVLYKQ